jgi:tRNA modification GTPase
LSRMPANFTHEILQRKQVSAHRWALLPAERKCARSSSILHSLPPLELRAALDTLGRIVGTTDTEDILGEIFTRFCIGK